MDLNKIYAKERIINAHFNKKYNYRDETVFKKQVLELLCELSEFAYETKCFKFWKQESQSAPEVTIPEFADCLMITLGFCDLAGIESIQLVEISQTDDMVSLFIEAYRLVSTLTMDLDKDKLLRIVSYLIAISKLLGYSDEELNSYCLGKMDKALSMVQQAD